MGEVVIKNAASGDTAKVTANQALKVSAVTERLRDHSCDSGIAQKFNINTGAITLTDDAATSVLYMKNNSTLGDLIITALIYNLGNNNGSGDVKIDVVRNPTTGDIITNGNNVLVGAGTEANQNFGSQNVLVADIYKGATAESLLDDGDVSVSTRLAANTGRIFIDLGNMSLPKGAYLGINYTPPSGNTSQIVQFAAACFHRTEELDT